MRILLYGLNYAPELTGIGKYSGEMRTWLINRGHQVRVVTTPPYYPAWRVEPPYRSNVYRIEPGKNGSIVYRCPLYVPSVPNGSRRMMHLFSFALSSLPVLMQLASWEPDVILTVEPTFFCAPIALFAGAVAGAPCWLHIQDFEVDAAFELGMLPSHGWLQRVALALEGFFTRRFTRVSTISANMVDRVLTKGVSPERALLFPNWVDIDSIRPTQGPSRYRKELGLGDKLILLYSGSLGNKQGLEVLGPLCASFRDDPRIHFLICGDGSLRHHLEEYAATHPNLTLLPLQPLECMNELLSTADIHLLPQRSGAADLVMPSKLNGMLASGRPVITTARHDTEVVHIIRGDPENGVEPRGLIVPPDDVQGFREAILMLRDAPDLRQRMGTAARQYAVEFLGKEAILRRFEQDLRDLLETPHLS